MDTVYLLVNAVEREVVSYHRTREGAESARLEAVGFGLEDGEEPSEELLEEYEIEEEELQD